MHGTADFEAIVLKNERLEKFSKSAMFSNVSLQATDSVAPDDEPQLQGTEPAAQWDAPVLHEGTRMV